MRRLVSSLIAIVVFAIAGPGCRSVPRSRVVRLMCNTDGSEWHFSVNGVEEGSRLRQEYLTNRLARLRLRHGDVVLFGNLPHLNSSQTAQTREWLSRYFDSNKVAIYVYPDVTKGDVFSVPTYHWVGALDNPRKLDDASFFLKANSWEWGWMAIK